MIVGIHDFHAGGRLDRVGEDHQAITWTLGGREEYGLDATAFCSNCTQPMGGWLAAISSVSPWFRKLFFARTELATDGQIRKIQHRL